MRLVRAFLAAALVALAPAGAAGVLNARAPAGVHLSLGAREDEMIVTWATFAPLASPTVRFGPLEDGAEDDAAARDARVGTRAQAATTRAFNDGGEGHRTRQIHVATLTNLLPGARYAYRVGDADDRDEGAADLFSDDASAAADPASSWSAPFAFTAKRTPEQISRSGDPLTFLAVCDIGHEESASLLKLLASEVRGAGKSPEADAPRPPDFLAHCGDFAYDLDDDDGAVGDAFMRDIEPIAAYVPYMTTAGNHEAAYNFSHYAARFEMPGATARATENQYYSFDYGPAHFVAWNTEAFFFPEYFDEAYMARMYAWLEEDLRRANANRANVPWIVAYSHRPMYCVETLDAEEPDAEDDERAAEVGAERGLDPRSAASLSPRRAMLARDANDARGWWASWIPSCARGTRRGGFSKKPTTPRRCEWEREATRLGVPSQCAAAHGLACALKTDATFEVSKPARTFPVEDLYHRYGVDVAFTGHAHEYARHYPVYAERVARGPGVTLDAYVNPSATAHVVTGAGGNRNMRDEGKRGPKRGACDASAPWCAFQSGALDRDDRVSDFGYGRVVVHNATHLEWTQRSVGVDANGGVVDRWFVVNDRHGGFSPGGG